MSKVKRLFSDALNGGVSIDFKSKDEAVAFRMLLYRYRWRVKNAWLRKRTAAGKHTVDALFKVQLSIQGTTLHLHRKQSKLESVLNET